MKRIKNIGILCFDRESYDFIKNNTKYQIVLFYENIKNEKFFYSYLNQFYCSHFIIFDKQEQDNLPLIKEEPVLIEINEKYMENYDLAFYVNEKLNEKYKCRYRFRNRVKLLNKINSVALYISLNDEMISNQDFYIDILNLIEEF